jgi:NTE family protein
MTFENWAEAVMTMIRISLVTMLLILVGCTRPIARNGPLLHYDGQSGYRFENIRPGPGNTDETFVVLLFSGGGTRAAAVAYGVLEGLRDTPITSNESVEVKTGPVTGMPGPDVGVRSLLDEVDAISSVSGGSFTAMAYALDHEMLFEGSFKKRFLYQNIQGRLLSLVLKPGNLLRLMYSVFDRTDLAADYYDVNVFDRRAYAELLDRGDRPFVVINAANMSLGDRFEFTQKDFDLLGSDLRTLPVSRAVAASSAFPLLLSPLRLQYHQGDAVNAAIAATLTAERARAEDPRRWRWANNLCPDHLESGGPPEHCLDHPNHRQLYLLDAGVVDNLGARWLIDEYRFGGIRELFQKKAIKRFVVIVVDAGTEPPNDIERHHAAPGLLMMGSRAASISVYHQTTALNGILRYFLSDQPRHMSTWHDEYERQVERLCPQALPLTPPFGHDFESYFIEVNFRGIPDEKLRRRCLTLPTSFFLSRGDVDTLIDVGRSGVESNPEFQRLLSDLGR